MRARTMIAAGAAALALAAGTVYAWPAAADDAEFTPEGRVWKEIFYEQFAMDLDPAPANCLAVEVQSLNRMVGPLVGDRPDDTPGSVWSAVDSCLGADDQDALARAIALGGWSFEEPAFAGVWDSAGVQLGGCVRAAGGWQAVGSFEAFLEVCQSTINALREGGNGA